jgi:hypothetical protein
LEKILSTSEVGPILALIAPSPFMKFDERNQFVLDPPIFVSMATAAKFVQPIPICFAYFVSLDVYVVPIKFLFGE